MTHEIIFSYLEGEGSVGWRGGKGKNWDSCNNIISKVFIKKRTKDNFMLKFGINRPCINLMESNSPNAAQLLHFLL